MATYPCATRCNHHRHDHPRMAALVPATARAMVDVGCGEGAHVLGVDPDPHARPGDSGSATFAQGRAEELPCASGSDDAGTMAMVLHHTDPRRYLYTWVEPGVPGA